MAFQLQGIPCNPGTVPAAVKLSPSIWGFLQSATAIRWEGEDAKAESEDLQGQNIFNRTFGKKRAMKNYFSLFVFICVVAVHLTVPATSLFAQQRDSSKTNKLDSITVTAFKKQGPADFKRFSPGTNIISYSGESIRKMQSASLADFIKAENAAYIKEYGRGMNAFLSIRGTSSSHTTIDWNGQNMSLPTMGQADLSHIPLYFFDAMDIHIGGGSALYGDGSIGGTVKLKTGAKWIKGHSGDVSLSLGSFGSLFTGATYRFSGEAVESRSSVLFNRALNNYTFENNTKPGKPVERLKNSAISNWGAIQELHAKAGKLGVFTASLMYLDFNREIQPSVSLNDRPETHNSIYDNNLKISASLEGSSAALSWRFSSAYAFDMERYKEDTISANRLMANADVEYRLAVFSLRGGVNGEIIKPDVESYIVDATEKRAGGYLIAKMEGVGLLSGSIGARYLYSTSGSLPLMPLVNARLKIPTGGGHSLYIRGSWSGNAKIPSLNDRYWGGNYVYLKSEKSRSTEAGINWGWYEGVWSASAFVTGYRSVVRDWIRWLPAGEVWRPRNIPEVLSRGVEAGADANYSASGIKLSLKASYAFTDIRTITPLWAEDPAKGEQLAYQPKHSWRATATAEYAKFTAHISLNHTGKRSTLDIYDILPDYTLTDAGISYRGKIKENEFIVGGILKNIFNVSYQNVKFYAMPGFNWLINFQFRF